MRHITAQIIKNNSFVNPQELPISILAESTSADRQNRAKRTFTPNSSAENARERRAYPREAEPARLRLQIGEQVQPAPAEGRSSGSPRGSRARRSIPRARQRPARAGVPPREMHLGPSIARYSGAHTSATAPRASNKSRRRTRAPPSRVNNQPALLGLLFR